MNNQPFLLEAVTTDNNILILRLRGDLTRQAEKEVLGHREWEKGLGGPRFLLIDFTGVPYINSAGIAILIRLVRSGKKGQFTVFAFGITPHYQKLFRMVGLTEYMMIYPDEYAIMQRIDML